MDYAESWSIRCQHESKLWDSSLFVTLTYDDDHLPRDGGLDVHHLQLFMKRLRKAYDGDISIPESGGRRPIRYFAAGEYGSETRRPHYHLLLFNLSLPDYSPLDGSGIELRSLRKLWPFGHHRVDGFTPGRAAYIAGYSAKKARGRVERIRRRQVVNKSTGEYTELPAIRDEFCVQSRRPVGLGVWWLNRHRRDFARGFVEQEGGVKKRLPRLYRDKLAESVDWSYDDENRREEFLMQLDPALNDPSRVAAREAVHRARISNFRKERQ